MSQLTISLIAVARGKHLKHSSYCLRFSYQDADMFVLVLVFI